jgi:cell pole-organizing protein PopZ
MEDILASIRRILSEDEAGAAPPAPPAGPETPPSAEATGSAAAPVAAAPIASDEPLDLTEDMLVQPPAPPSAPSPDPVPLPASQPPVVALPVSDVDRALLAPDAAAAAAASVGSLLRAVAADRASPVHRGGPSIEDVVREELRPLLKAWLDQHLPPLVERLVQAEIERVVRRALS